MNEVMSHIGSVRLGNDGW